MIAGLILAAGASNRLGQPKQLLPLGESTLLGKTLQLARAKLDPLVVVLGAVAEDIQRVVDFSGVRVVENLHYREGQASSLIAGLRALADLTAVDAAIVLLGDQPLVPAQVIDRLLAEWAAKPELHAVVPLYGTQRGNPVLFSRAAWPALVTLTGDTGARPLFATGQLDPSTTVAFPAEWWPNDVDTLADYQQVLRDYANSLNR